MGRNKFKGKRGDYGQNQNNATSFVKVIHRPTGKVAGQYVEVVVLVLQDALEDAAKDEEERRRSRGIVGTGDLTSATGADTVYEFEFDTSKVLSEIAIFRHKGFKTLGPGSHGGSKSHVPGLGGRCTKVELVDMYGSPDMETCLRAVVSEQIIKLLRLRAKATTRAEALAVGAGNREWRGSALGPAHRFFWSIQSNAWMSAERQEWVEMIFAIVIRLRCLAERNLDKLDARESADAADPAAAAEAAKASEAAEAENGGGPPKIACLRGKRLFTWLPNEMWVHILSHIRRSNIGPNDALASIQLATGGGKLKIGHVPSGGGKMRSVSGRSAAASEDGDAAPAGPLSQDGNEGYDADVSAPGSRATSGRAGSDAPATAGRSFEQEGGPAVPSSISSISSTSDRRTARDPSDPQSGPSSSGSRRSKPDGAAAAADGSDGSGPSASPSGAAETGDDWGASKRGKGKGKAKRGKKGNKRWDEEEDEAEAAAASGSVASEPAPPARGGKGKAAKGKKNKKGRRWDEEDDDEEAAAAAAAAPEREGEHGDDDDIQLGRSEEKALSKTAKKAKRREQRAARAQAFGPGDSILDGEGDIDATLDAMIMGGGKKGKKKKKNSGVRQNYDHAPGGTEEESGGATIPCDVCGKQVPLMLFVAHSEECNARIRREAAADQAFRGPDDA